MSASLAALDLERTPGGWHPRRPETLRTSNRVSGPGGDVARGPRNLIDAIADGKRAAASIHAALTGAPTSPGRAVTRSASSCARGFRRLDSDYDAIPRQPIPATPTERRVGFGEVETGYDERQARLEGLRCLRCFDNVMLSPELCILCGLCVDVCPPNCITIARADHVGVGTRAAVGAPPRRGPLHPLRPVRQSLPAGRVVDGPREGVARMTDVDTESLEPGRTAGRPRRHGTRQAQ